MNFRTDKRMWMKKIVFAPMLFLAVQIYGQQPKDVDFSQKVFYSGFTSADKNIWPQVNNEFYFFLIKDSTYIIECSNSEKKAYLLPKGSPKLDSFKAEAEITLPDNKKGDGGAVGLALDIQDKLSGGYLVEINNKQQFRVVSIDANGGFSALSNNGKKDGWEAYSVENEEAPILISAVQLGRKVSISLAGVEVFNFNNTIKVLGQNGLFISGNYKTKASNFAVYAPGKNLGLAQNSHDISTMNNSLIDCKKENRELADKNDHANQELAEARYKNKELQTYISQNLDVKLQEELAKQKERADKLQAENDQLKKESADLKELKKTIEQNKDGDLVMVLSENLKKEEEKNAALEKKIKLLTAKKPAKKK